MPHSKTLDAVPSDRPEMLGALGRYRRPILAVTTIVIFVLVGVAIFHLTSEIRYDDVVGTLEKTSAGDVALAILFTALSFCALIAYDLNALVHVGKKLPLPDVALTAFSAYAVGNTAGFGALSGGAIRYRAYSRLGLTPEEIGRVIAFVTLAFGLGLAAVSSVTILAMAPEIGAMVGVDPLLLRTGAGIVAAALATVAILGRNGRAITIGRTSFHLPDGPTSLRQFGVTAIDIAFSGLVLYALLPADATVSMPAFLAIYAIAVGLGVLSHVPAGLGVFETVIIAGVGGSASVDAILGSLVLYRAIYHVLPLALAIVIVSATEAWQLAHHPVASSIRRVGARLSPPLLATLSIVLGIMLIFSSVLPTPDENLQLLADHVPLPLLEGAHFLSSLLGLALVVAARGLGQRLDGAWWTVVCCAAAALAFAFLKAIALFEAAALVFFLVSLLVSRRQFERPASLLRQAMSPSWIAAMTVICISAIVVLLFVYRDVEYSHELWWQFEFEGEAPRGLRAILGLAIASSAIAAFGLLRPVNLAGSRATADALDQAVTIARRQDMADANLVRMGDKKLLFAETGDAFIMYGVQGRTWIALFDPVGERKAFRELVWRFVEAAREAGCRPVFYQISPALLPSCADTGLRAFKLGELAVVDLTAFDLKGGKGANLRQTASRAARDGLTFSVLQPGDAPGVVDDLATVSDAWLAHHKTREKGFSLGAFDRDYVCSQPVAILRRENRIVAFATIMVTDTRAEGTVDLMRFAADAPKGSMDFLFVRILEHLRDAGYKRFNLGMAPLSGMSKRSVAPVWDRIGGAVFEHGERFYNFKGLRAFKAKFSPEWEPRYLAVSGSIGPLIALLDSTLLISGGLKGVVGK